jgi:hypothetical protein
MHAEQPRHRRARLIVVDDSASMPHISWFHVRAPVGRTEIASSTARRTGVRVLMR